MPLSPKLHHTLGAPIPPAVLPLHGTVVGRDYLQGESGKQTQVGRSHGSTDTLPLRHSTNTK